jgi:hypothetical protein
VWSTRGWTLDFPLNSWSMMCGDHQMDPGFSSSSFFNCSWSMRCAVHEMDPGFSSPSFSIVLDLWVVKYTGWALDFPLNHFIDGSWFLRFSFFIVVNDSENLTLLTKPYRKGFTTSASMFSFFFEHAGKQIFNIIINLYRIIRDCFSYFLLAAVLEWVPCIVSGNKSSLHIFAFHSARIFLFC